MAFVALPFAAAYAMSKHGVVAYSQALRLEHGDAISVSTVYPGYIRTPIHKDSVDFGLTLEGNSPEESLDSAVGALTRAALGEPPVRDLITTRTGKVTVALSRYAPGRFRRLGDPLPVPQTLRQRRFDDPSSPPAVFARRLAGRGRRRWRHPEPRQALIPYLDARALLAAMSLLSAFSAASPRSASCLAAAFASAAASATSAE